MSVEPDPESLDTFPSETNAPLAVRRRRAGLRLPWARTVAAIGGVFTLGVLTGHYFSDLIALRATRRVDSAVIVAGAVEPVAPLPLPGSPMMPFQQLRPAIGQFTAAAAVDSRRAPAENTRRRNDARAIQSVLNRYRDAFSTLDVAAVRAVWPTADVNDVRRAFATLAEQNLDFDACRITSGGAHATASCAGVVESGFRSGDRRPRSENKHWQFTLRRTGQRWTITGVRDSKASPQS